MTDLWLDPLPFMNQRRVIFDDVFHLIHHLERGPFQRLADQDHFAGSEVFHCFGIGSGCHFETGISGIKKEKNTEDDAIITKVLKTITVQKSDKTFYGSYSHKESDK